MSPETDLSGDYDVIVIGARPAGAGTALLLARLGLRVLVLDRGQYGADTLSTHALMRGGVLQLARWGVLPRVIAAGTPPVRAATFIYGEDTARIPVKPRDGIDALWAPRRTVLDRAIANMAMEAGAAFAYGATLVDLLWTRDGRVRGIAAQIGSGTARLGAGLVVGADGHRSLVARLVGAAVTTTGTASAATVFGYWSDVPVDGYRWYYGPGLSAGAIPTNDGLTCIFASIPTSRFAEVFRGDIERGYRQVLADVAPDLAVRLRHGALVGGLKGTPGQPGFLRHAAGPGWALVGDAGYFKDPLTAHGITAALIDAEHLARAVVASGGDVALAAYAADRDRRAAAMFEVTDRIASFDWTLDRARELHKRLAQAMADEVKALNAVAEEALPV